MTVAERKRSYQYKLGRLRATRVGRLHPRDWPWQQPYRYYRNRRVCATVQERRGRLERLGQ